MSKKLLRPLFWEGDNHIISCIFVYLDKYNCSLPCIFFFCQWGLIQDLCGSWIWFLCGDDSWWSPAFYWQENKSTYTVSLSSQCKTVYCFAWHMLTMLIFFPDLQSSSPMTQQRLKLTSAWCWRSVHSVRGWWDHLSSQFLNIFLRKHFTNIYQYLPCGILVAILILLVWLLKTITRSDIRLFFLSTHIFNGIVIFLNVGGSCLQNMD